MSCVTRTRCSWVSSQNASKRSVRESTGSSGSGEGLEGAAAGGCCDGGGGGWDEGLANVSLGIAQEAITSLILMKLVLVRGHMAGIIYPLRSRDTGVSPLDRYGFYGVEPGLIVIEGHPPLVCTSQR